ncbi:ABC-type Fe3+-hydroxamate transport system, periplasmic component [Solibacillus silvestris StLB046]|uniref:ABC-type Fe3+-hydroxamate transport system, periplasmic component n=1 Tax=Solibacillus silvestris (strain StLB046) TaxID=1002809 RepID=F2F0A0_SOLSS|nr:ABC transporter substrate-binding protein [Solibacillus silvestris]BAK15210.1 ABC-type Fe3+-hydroxamate transport system, periplasmic component [Solibacillus silvestris StLB046]
MAGRKAILTTLALAAMALAACSDKEATTSTSDGEVQTTAEEKIVIDQAGTEVTIPVEVNSIVSGGILPYFHTWYVATNSAKEIVGMHPNSYNAAENSILSKMAPDILKADTSFVQNGEMNVEELMKINPDVFFEIATDEKSIEQARNTGINTVAIKAIDAAAAEPLATFNSWLKLTGEIASTTERADKFIEIGTAVQNEIYEKIDGLTKEQKPNALMMYQLSEQAITVGGKNFFGNQWLNATGANDVAENDVTGRKDVNMEQIYNWNPEIIYLTNFTEIQPEDLYNNTIPGQDWSEVEAVKNKHVYKIPLGIYRWFPPSGDAPLMLKWLASNNQPELFDYDMNAEIKNYYKDFYGYDVTDEEVEQILHPSSDAAKY